MDFMKRLKDIAKTPEQKMALENCIGLFVTGSQLYGTNTPASDIDYEGIFVETPEYILGNKSCDEVSFSTGDDKSRNTSEDIDCKLYSLRKYFSLAQQNNPNKVEWFFIPDDKFVLKTNYWDWIAEYKHLFLSLKLKHSFSGYAKSQEHKLVTKKKRYEELRSFRDILQEGISSGKEIIGDMDLLEIHEHKKYHRDTDTVGTHQVPRMKEKYHFIEYKRTSEDTDGIRVDNKDYNFGMPIQRIFDYVNKEVETYGGRLEYVKEYGFDVKFAAHLFRLYFEGLRLLKDGNLVFPMPEEEVKFMMDIKAGKYDLDFLLKKSKDLEPQFETAYEENLAKLPYTPNHADIDVLQRDMILAYWKYKELI